MAFSEDPPPCLVRRSARRSPLLFAAAAVAVIAAAALVPPPAVGAPTNWDPTMRADTNSPWNYSGMTGPNNWGLLDPAFATCGTGRQQSPINVQVTPTNYPRVTLFSLLTPGTASFTAKTSINNVPLKCTSNTCGTLNWQFQTYNLVNVHGHAPAEHTINGRAFPFEMHFVHIAPGDHIAVVGVLFDYSPVDNPLINKLFEAEQNAATGAGDTGVGVTGAEWGTIERPEAGFCHHMGSLTTPPCTEQLAWFIEMQVMPISVRQVARFRDYRTRNTGLNELGNNRPLQPTNGRQITCFGPVGNLGVSAVRPPIAPMQPIVPAQQPPMVPMPVPGHGGGVHPAMPVPGHGGGVHPAMPVPGHGGGVPPHMPVAPFPQQPQMPVAPFPQQPQMPVAPFPQQPQMPVAPFPQQPQMPVAPFPQQPQMPVAPFPQQPQMPVGPSGVPPMGPGGVPLQPGVGGEPVGTADNETDINPTCFPGSASVTRFDGTTVALREVDTGDALVVDAAGGTSPVFMWSHRLPAGEYPFVRLRTASGSALTASAGHLVYASGALVRAGSVRVGDTLERVPAVCAATGTCAATADAVVAVDAVMATGLYAPQVLDGVDVVVDGFRVSTLTTAVRPAAAVALMAPLRWAYRAGWGSVGWLHGDGGRVAEAVRWAVAAVTAAVSWV